MIKPICDFCKKELEEPGAIVFSPPYRQYKGEKLPKDICVKLHMCRTCYKNIILKNSK